MQLRMSPGGGTPSSLRSRPLEPPSSVTVTMPVRRETTGAIGGGAEVPAAEIEITWRLSPRSRVERPVPPPMATTRRPLRLVVVGGVGIVIADNRRAGDLPCAVAILRQRGSRSDAAFRVKQLGESRVVGHVTEIRVIARLETVAGIEPDCLGQVP